MASRPEGDPVASWTPPQPIADSPQARILVVENQALVRELLVVACRYLLPRSTVYSAASAADALTACEEHKPELMLLDLVLPDGDGLDCLPAFFERAPDLRIIALSSHIDEFTLHRALKAKVHGIVDKNEQPVKVLGEAIHEVLSGRSFISTGAQRVHRETRSDPASFLKVLSEREQQVLRLIGQGLNNDEIGKTLSLSANTARNHRINIMVKLDIHSAPQLIRYAIDKGFVHLAEGPRPTRSTV